MNSRQAIKNTIQTADMVCGAYLGDLNDDELMKRPHSGCNHLNWQIGHLIASDHSMVNGCCPGALPELPAGFADKYSKETKDSNDKGAFYNKAELLEIHEKQRAAIFEKLDSLSDEELDAAAPEEMQAYAANVGSAFNMLGSHWMMHAGQWVVVRRELGKDIVI